MEIEPEVAQSTPSDGANRMQAIKDILVWVEATGEVTPQDEHFFETQLKMDNYTFWVMISDGMLPAVNLIKARSWREWHGESLTVTRLCGKKEIPVMCSISYSKVSHVDDKVPWRCLWREVMVSWRSVRRPLDERCVVLPKARRTHDAISLKLVDKSKRYRLIQLCTWSWTSLETYQRVRRK